MSISAMVAVRDYSTLKGSRLLLLLMIADLVNDLDGNCARNIPLQLLCDRARLDRRNAKHLLYDLVAANEAIIQIIPGKVSIYAIPILEGEEGYAPEQCDASMHDCGGFHTPLSVLRDVKPKGARRSKPRQKRYGTRIGRGTGTPTSPEVVHGGVNTPLHGGVPVPLPRVYTPLHGGVQEPLLHNPLLSLNIPRRESQRADAREGPCPPHEKNVDGDAEIPGKEPTPPPPPLAPHPDVPEARLAWREVRLGLAGKISPAVLSAWGPSCHLYPVGPGQWQLRLGTGVNVPTFRARFEALITDQLCAYAREGNQLLQIVGAT
jgi:hypothetical protein